MISRTGILFARLLAGVGVWNAGAVGCFAHPDHPLVIVPGSSPLHYFVQPEHALPLVVFAVAVWWMARTANAQSVGRVLAKKITQAKDRRLG